MDALSGMPSILSLPLLAPLAPLRTVSKILLRLS